MPTSGTRCRREEGLRGMQLGRPRRGSSSAEGELGVEALEMNPKRRRGIKQEAWMCVWRREGTRRRGSIGIGGRVR